jgi:hypothetical protein
MQMRRQGQRVHANHVHSPPGQVRGGEEESTVGHHISLPLLNRLHARVPGEAASCDEGALPHLQPVEALNLKSGRRAVSGGTCVL